MLSVYQVMAFLAQSVIGTAIVLGAIYLIVVRSGLAYALYMRFAPDEHGRVIGANTTAVSAMQAALGLTSAENSTAGETLISNGVFSPTYATTNAITAIQLGRIRAKESVGFQLAVGISLNEADAQVREQEFAPLRISFPLMPAPSQAM